MAGRKVFTSGEILTAADVNSFLMDQSVMVFADSSARSSAIPTPSEGMVTYVEDSNRVEVYDGAAFGPIGGILQVVSTTKIDPFTTTSTSFTDLTGLSAAITPSSASSKILVFLSVSVNARTNSAPLIVMERNGTPVGSGTAVGIRPAVFASFFTNDVQATSRLAGEFLDSPNSTSALTYQVRVRTSSGTLGINTTANDADVVTQGRTSSSITLMEVSV